jgi:uncharacterized membrane protein
LNRYELLKFVHVLAAAVWIGGVLMMQAFALRARSSKNPAHMAAVAGDIGILGKRIMMPSSLTVLVAGFLLIWDGPWTLGMEWVWLSLIIYAVSFALGVGYFEPEGKRIAALIEGGGGASPEVQQRITRNLRLSHLDLLMLIVILFLMVTKPGV